MSDIRRMTVGQLVDFCIDYNKRNKESNDKKPEKPKRRRATQAEIDAFFG